MDNTISSRLKVFTGFLLFIILVGAFGFSRLEDLSLADAFYFSVVTITTVGFGDIHPITVAGKYLALLLIVFGGIAFLGVVATVTEMLVSKRERQNRMQKLNLVVGAFFSELGNRLMDDLTGLDMNLNDIRQHLLVSPKWHAKNFRAARIHLKQHHFKLDVSDDNLKYFNSILTEKSDLLLQLLMNTSLLEHETFTDLIQAVSHLKEELLNREDFETLPDADIKHLKNDTERIYKILVHQWLDYMIHIKTDYPYLFSLATRKNPFAQKQQIVFLS